MRYEKPFYFKQLIKQYGTDNNQIGKYCYLWKINYKLAATAELNELYTVSYKGTFIGVKHHGMSDFQCKDTFITLLQVDGLKSPISGNFFAKTL